MGDKLKEAFYRYMDAIQSKFQNKNEQPKENKLFFLVVNKEKKLRDLVEELEEEIEFLHLVEETRSSFSKDYHRKGELGWEQAVQNLFRHYGYYFDIFEGNTLSKDSTFQNYCEAFERREIHIRYLSPIERVHFADSSIDFGTFQVRKFGEEELGEVLQNKINKVFYPWATLDVGRLNGYWFIDVTEVAPMPKLGTLEGYISPRAWTDYVEHQYTKYPKPTEACLQQLALFDWQTCWSKNRRKEQPKDWRDEWLGFKIPFVLKVDNNPLSSPKPAPDLSKLETMPSIDALGAEIGEEPIILIPLN